MDNPISWIEMLLMNGADVQREARWPFPLLVWPVTHGITTSYSLLFAVLIPVWWGLSSVRWNFANVNRAGSTRFTGKSLRQRWEMQTVDSHDASQEQSFMRNKQREICPRGEE